MNNLKQVCPKCRSDDVRIVDYMGIPATVCRKCGYDQRKMYEIVPEERGSQKAKGRYSPYKAGGGRRAQKRK